MSARGMASLAEAERRVCDALANGAAFNLRIYTKDGSTVFEMHRDDAVVCDAEECLALIATLGMNVVMRLERMGFPGQEGAP